MNTIWVILVILIPILNVVNQLSVRLQLHQGHTSNNPLNKKKPIVKFIDRLTRRLYFRC